MAMRKPSPGAPMIALAGRRTRSNFNRASGCGAITSIRSTTLSPGVAAGTMNAANPRAPSSLVRANSVMTSAIGPFEM